MFSKCLDTIDIGEEGEEERGGDMDQSEGGREREERERELG
jgi:hypothetical protein